MSFNTLFIGILELSQYRINQDYLIKILAIGIFLSLICGITFAYIMRDKIKSWEKEKESPLPLASNQTLSSWLGFFIGLTLIFSAALQIFNFSLLNSTIFAILNALLFGIVMWRAIKDLMVQLESGEIKEIDDYL